MKAGGVCGVRHPDLLAIFAGQKVFAPNAIDVALGLYLDAIANADLVLELPGSV